MFQGMFRKRGRPPEPPLQIGGYDEPNQNESIQIPGHQLRNAPRQLPLPAVREFDQVEVAEQEQSGFNQAIVESSSVQQRQIDVDMLDSHNQRLIPNNPQNSTVFGQKLIPIGLNGSNRIRAIGMVDWTLMNSSVCTCYIRKCGSEYCDFPVSATRILPVIRREIGESEGALQENRARKWIR